MPALPPPDCFYVCVYLKDGKPIGHRGRTDNIFPETLHGKDDASDNKPSIKRSSFVAISRDFVNTMMGYLEYVPLILSLAPMISQQMVHHSLQKFLEANCSSSDRSASRIIYEFPRQKFPSVRRFEDNLEAATSTSRALPRLLTVGLVSTLEYHLNLIMKEIAASNPEAIFGRDKALLVRDIVKFDSMDELKEHMINDEIDKAQRENFDSQVGWIISKVQEMDDFRPNYPDWPALIELCERRNLFVHSNGIVNDSYLKAHAKYKFPKGKDRSLGDELHAGPEYFNNSVHRVIHFGAMLLQVVWRKSTDEAELADKAIGELGYELIVRGQYSLAVRILEFARNLRNVSSELHRRMNIVNLANAHKLGKDDKAASKVLASEDWSAAGLEFKACVSAVEGKIEELVDLMNKIGPQGDVTAEAYQEWPAFYSVREHAQFTDAFRSIFGFEYVPSSKKQAGLAQVMEWMKEQKLDANATVIAETIASIQPAKPG